MLMLDLMRTIACAFLGFMVGALIGAWLWETRELWGMAIGGLALIVGTAIAMHRDEVRAYSSAYILEH